MSTETETVPAVRVHVASSDVALGSSQPSGRKQVHCRAYTVVLTSTNSEQTILDRDDKRLYALVQAGGNDAVINNNKGEIRNSANTTATLPNPIGMVLPAGNTFPTKIPGGEHWHATAAAYPTQVTVLCVMEGD